jgi:hypothetical protein
MNRTGKVLLLVFACFFMVTPDADAQGPQLGIGVSRSLDRPTHGLHITGPWNATDSLQRSDSRYAGLLIGGVVLGAAGALLVHWGCVSYSGDPEESCVPQTIGGGAVGAVVGGLIGYFVGRGIHHSGRTP